MNFHIMTLFPDMVLGGLNESITGKAIEKGLIGINITEKTGLLASMRLCAGDEDLMLIRTDGTVIRTDVKSISVISRYAQGVKLMRVDEGTRIASVALVGKIAEDELSDADEAAPVE